jgi:hypothetical protein
MQHPQIFQSMSWSKQNQHFILYMALFRYVTSLGTFEQDTFPSSGVYELTLQRNAIRFQKDGIRSHESHPLHEKAMKHLPTDLTVLRMDGTKVRTFPTLPTTLEELYAECNYFINVPDLSYATNLQVMNLCDGRIEVFEGALPPKLHTLDIRNNALKRAIPGLNFRTVNARVTGNPFMTHGIKNQRGTVGIRPEPRVIRPGKVAPIQMNTVMVGNVLIEDLSGTRVPTAPPVEPHQVNFLGYIPYDTQERHREPQQAVPATILKKTVYENTQNVHDSGVQDSTSKNISYLIERAKKHQKGGNAYLERMDAAIKNFKARDPRRNIFQKLFSFIRSMVFLNSSVVTILESFINIPYAMHGVSFRDLLESVWIRIETEKNPDTKDELIRRLCEEVKDGEYRCTGGMMVRLCNIFIGFDENITIELRPNDILQSRIPATMTRVRKEMNLKEDDELPTEYWIKCFKETENDLKEVGLDEFSWKDWLEPIFQPMAPELRLKLEKELGKKWQSEEVFKIKKIFEEFGISFAQWMRAEV